MPTKYAGGEKGDQTRSLVLVRAKRENTAATPSAATTPGLGQRETGIVAFADWTICGIWPNGRAFIFLQNYVTASVRLVLASKLVVHSVLYVLRVPRFRIRESPTSLLIHAHRENLDAILLVLWMRTFEVN